MKKLIATVFATVLMTVGLVSVSGGTAANAAGNYAAATPILSVYHPNIKPKGSKATIHVSLIGGRTSPKGTVTVRIQGPGKNLSKVLSYSGKQLKFKIGKLKKRGKYKIWVTFTSSTKAYTNVGPQRFGFIKVRFQGK